MRSDDESLESRLMAALAQRGPLAAQNRRNYAANGIVPFEPMDEAAEPATVAAEPASLAQQAAAIVAAAQRPGPSMLGPEGDHVPFDPNDNDYVPFVPMCEAAEPMGEVAEPAAVAAEPAWLEQAAATVAAAQQSQAAEQPATEPQGAEARGREVSRSASRESAAAIISSSQRLRLDRSQALRDADVPAVVADTLARGDIKLSHVKAMGATWALGVCATKSVEPPDYEVTMLHFYFPDPAPSSAGSRSVPPAAQAQVPSSAGSRSVPLAAQAPAQHEAPPQAVIPFFYHKCATKGCKCEASFNGAADTACCRTCRDGGPCDRATGTLHDLPFETPSGFVAMPMPSAKRALAKELCRMPHIRAKPTPLISRYSKAQLQAKLWTAQFRCSAVGAAFASKAAAGDDDDAGSDASMHELVSNASTDTSDGVSEAAAGEEVVEAAAVEEVVEAPAPAKATPAQRLCGTGGSRSQQLSWAAAAASECGGGGQRARRQRAKCSAPAGGECGGGGLWGQRVRRRRQRRRRRRAAECGSAGGVGGEGSVLEAPICGQAKRSRGNAGGWGDGGSPGADWPGARITAGARNRQGRRRAS